MVRWYDDMVLYLHCTREFRLSWTISLLRETSMVHCWLLLGLRILHDPHGPSLAVDS